MPGTERGDHDHRGEHRPAERQREGGGERDERGPGVALQIKEGEEHDGGRERRTEHRGQDASPGLRAALHRIRHRAEPLDHHEPVLHQDPDAHAEAGEREEIGRDVEEVEPERGPRDGDGSAPHHECHRFHIAERQRQHEHHRRKGDGATEHQLVELLLQVDTFVVLDAQLDSRRQRRVEPRHELAHRGRRLDGVGAGKPGDGE